MGYPSSNCGPCFPSWKDQGAISGTCVMYVQEQYIGEGCLHQGGPKGTKRIKARKYLSCDSEIL